jgi:CPA2 family monovalent cation:H+ antiporter-2
MIDLEVNQQADYAGRTLEELGWREQYGINIAYIKRGDKLIYAPGRNNKLLPFDQVGVIATDNQMQQFKPVFDAKEKVPTGPGAPDTEDIVLQK